MAQSLEVNNKTYLPSVVLAKEFNYTSDYISKLARDEKVLGTRVGRQWFVEPESLRTFILQLEVEKRIIKEDLSIERKRERAEKSREHKQGLYVIEPAVVVGGKSVAVVLCGFILGCLMLFGYMQELRPADLVFGSTFIGQQLHQKIGIGFASLVSKPYPPVSTVATLLMSEQPVTATSVVNEAEELVIDVYTVFPDIAYATTSHEIQVDDSLAVAQEPGIKNLPFSDEVIFEEIEGALGVRPVFKDYEGHLYELSVTAIKRTQ